MIEYKKLNKEDVTLALFAGFERRQVVTKCWRQLFSRVGEWAREQGAEALYISAHSSVESQAFYRAMGCRLAQEVQSFHVQEEPFDVQMECPLA